MSTLFWERLFKNYEMYNKNHKLRGQNCKCTEEEKEMFFSAVKKGTGSNCCRVNSKGMALFLSTPALFLLLYVKTCTRTDQTSLPLFPLILKEPSPLHNQKKRKPQKGKRNTYKNRNKKYHPKTTNPPTNFGEKVFQFSSLPLL